MTASSDGTARLWDAGTGRPIGEPLRAHRREVQAAAFSPDGKRIVTASTDNTALLWDAETGKPISEPLRGHEDTVLSAAFSPDGKRIVTASVDKTARLWNVFATQELVTHAKTIAPRCLSPALRKQSFLPPEPPDWCIEMEKWPYHTPVWKQWLANKKAGEQVELPAERNTLPVVPTVH